MVRVWMRSRDGVAGGAPFNVPDGKTVGWPRDQIVVWNSSGHVVAVVTKKYVRMVIADGQPPIEIYEHVPEDEVVERCGKCWGRMPKDCRCGDA